MEAAQASLKGAWVSLDSASHVRMLFERMTACAGDPALFRDGAEISFDGLLSRVAAWERDLLERGLGAGTVCAFTGDYAPDTIALMLAPMRLGGISLPLTLAAVQELGDLLAISGAQWLIRFNDNLDRAGASVEPLGATAQNGLIVHFRATGHPGLIVFTSGSSGRPKGILHDFDRVLGKFAVRRPGWRTILFLSIDHFGGINTLMACLAYGGVGICVSQRTPDIVCGLWRRHAPRSCRLRQPFSTCCVRPVPGGSTTCRRCGSSLMERSRCRRQRLSGSAKLCRMSN